MAILSLEIVINSASARSKAWAGNAVYKGTKGVLKVKARAFLVFKDGDDDFYVSSQWILEAKNDMKRDPRVG